MLRSNSDDYSDACVSKINNTFIDNAEDLEIAIPIYNFLEYSNNYSDIRKFVELL